ncbi:MAG TPA: hypothetical protein VK659_18540 [Asanoa sp.]|nr:hypothetical protein [Asanoa sp.]
MDARPLKDVFTDLVGDPSAGADALAAAGHDLPADLVAEAVVSFAGTAPAEVAEHLAPFVTANSGVPTQDAGTDDWFALLATAPDPDAGEDLDDGTVIDAAPAAHAGIGELEFGAGADAGSGTDLDAVTDDDLDADPDDFDDSTVDATADLPADEPALDLDADLDDAADDDDDSDDDDGADGADLDG